jgi:hypothetical protein
MRRLSSSRQPTAVLYRSMRVAPASGMCTWRRGLSIIDRVGYRGDE